MQAKTETPHVTPDLRTLASEALVSDDALIAFGQRIDMQVERIGGKLIVSPPMGFDGSVREGNLFALLHGWAAVHGYVASSPSGNYRLADGEAPAPDVGLVRRSRVEAMNEEARKTIPRLVPDIVVELLSESQRTPNAVAIAEAKCKRWFEAGVGYVVLVDPFGRKTATWGDGPDDFPNADQLLDPPR